MCIMNKKSLLCFPLCLMLSGCYEENAEQKQSNQTKQLLSIADQQIGMPAINKFSEKKMAKDMLELRDKSVPTFTYISNDIKGCLMYLGNSIGYGIPYSTQFTNPMKLVSELNSQSSTIPQAEPNGLYMPENASATWVMLYDEKSKTIHPTYIEQNVLVTPARLSNIECQ